MKKLLIGCGVVTLLAVIILAGLGIFAFLKVQKFAQGFTASIDSIEQMESRYPFTRPDSLSEAELEPERLDAWFDVRQAVLDKLESNEMIMAIKAQDQNYQASIGDNYNLVAEFLPSFFQTFSDKLDEHQMAPSEYSYITRLVYSAVKQGAGENVEGLSAVYDQLQSDMEVMNKTLSEADLSGTGYDLESAQGKLDIPDVQVSEEVMNTVKARSDRLKETADWGFAELVLVTFIQEVESGGLTPQQMQNGLTEGESGGEAAPAN